MSQPIEQLVYKALLQALFAFSLLFCLTGDAYARDVRVAVLVGNQQGWKGDPKLRYIVSGDLRPMKKVLKRAGFRIFTVLENRSADALRKTFRKILQRAQQKPRITTFFFYYSGHADKRYFHMGPKGKNPLAYKEFIDFLRKLKVKRRFGIIDACFSGEIIRQFGALKRYRELLSKGVLQKGFLKKLKRYDLTKHFPNRGEQVRGLQLLSSSRSLSFESRRLKGSVFTHFLLEGIRGEADLNRDGRISFNELFMFAKPKVKSYTGQSPQQWLFRVGGESYSFVPAYHSQLRIGASVVGKLQIEIGNFVWKYQKRQKRSLRLSVVSGKGRVRLKRHSRCFHQEMFFPKGGSTTLRAGGWKQTACGRRQLTNKGLIQLPAYQVPFRPLHSWLLEVQGGGWASNGALQKGGDLSGGGMLGLRWKYFAILAGIWGTSLSFQDGTYTQLGLDFRFESGFRKRWGFFEGFLGGYASVGTLLQDVNMGFKPGWSAQFGVTLAPAFWFSESWALALHGDFGVMPNRVRDQWRFFTVGSLRLGIRFML